MRIVSTINFDEKKKKEKKKSGETREFVYVYMLNWNSSSVENLHSPAWGKEGGGGGKVSTSRSGIKRA